MQIVLLRVHQISTACKQISGFTLCQMHKSILFNTGAESCNLADAIHPFIKQVWGVVGVMAVVVAWMERCPRE